MSGLTVEFAVCINEYGDYQVVGKKDAPYDELRRIVEHNMSGAELKTQILRVTIDNGTKIDETV